MKKIGAIVLAAGKGTRLNSKIINKVMLPLCGRPMIGYTIDLLKKTGFTPIVVVVGFKREAVMDYFKNRVLYVFQKKRLGTAHAASCALKILPNNVKDVLIVNGDDSYFYSPKLLKKLIRIHKERGADLTLLTVEKDNPTGLGRILRNKKREVVGIVEHKDASFAQRKIKEINPQCWFFKKSFLHEFLPKVKKSEVTGEYYLTDLVALAVGDGRKIETVRAGKIPWRGVNTAEELNEARKMVKDTKM